MPGFNAMVLSLLVCLFAGMAPKAYAAPVEESAQQLLHRSDAIRNPHRSFSLTVDLFEYRDGRLASSMRLDVYARPDEGGRYANLIRFDLPQPDHNKLMLYRGDEIWFYDPGSNASFRLSPQQRLIGQAANGDVVTTSFALDYKARVVSKGVITDGDRKPCDCVQLELTAASSKAVYSRIEYWQNVRTANPVKAKYFSASGQLMKTAYFRRFANELGVERPTETVIIDGLNSKLVTIMRYSNYAAVDVPELWMQRDYLPRFSAP